MLLRSALTVVEVALHFFERVGLSQLLGAVDALGLGGMQRYLSTSLASNLPILLLASFLVQPLSQICVHVTVLDSRHEGVLALWRVLPLWAGLAVLLALGRSVLAHGLWCFRGL